MDVIQVLNIFEILDMLDKLTPGTSQSLLIVIT